MKDSITFFYFLLYKLVNVEQDFIARIIEEKKVLKYTWKSLLISSPQGEV